MNSNDIIRVKYYSKNDMSIGFYMERIEEILCTFKIEEKIVNINEIIELYNIQQFFKNKIYLRYWTEEERNNYISTVKEFSKVIGKYFSEIDINELESIFITIDYEYDEDFWKIIEEYKIYKKIPDKIFQNIMYQKGFYLRSVLKCKTLVKYFSEVITQYMEENPLCAEILLSYYLEEHNRDIEDLSFPQELSNEKKIAILESYILSDSSNSNYIKLIFNSNTTNDLYLPDRLKLKAKRKYNEQMEDLFKNSAGIEYGVQIAFSDEQVEEKKFEIGKNRVVSISYSRKWIKENIDYPTLLNNFIYLFEYVDSQFRCLHVRKESQIGTLEKCLGIKGKREYHTGIVFRQIQILAQLQIIGYSNELEKYNIQLEEIIKWFFEDYLKNEFNASGFSFNISSKNASYLEKCRNIAAEIDSILKQFKLWCEDGKIDNELLHISTEHIFIRDIPSMINNKYIYPYGEEYKIVSYLLFSDQSIIHYIPELSRSYNTFYELLENQNIYYYMFKENQLTDIHWLIEHKIIKLDAKKKIVPYKDKIRILHELYTNDVLCWNYIKKYKSIIEELQEQGILEFGASLFSKSEQDYYNYLFNKSQFSNGLDIRNCYIHGTQIIDEEQNKQDYYIFLRIMFLIIIKINEEFCLKELKI